MKPTIPDVGIVVRLQGEKAVIRMKHEGSCRKCGAAALGMCKAGFMQELIVRNKIGAQIGDTVKIGLVKYIQYTGYVLAYTVPAAALLVGIAAGYFLREYAGFKVPDALMGFAFMFTASFFSFRKLKHIDSASSIEIVGISSPAKAEFHKPDEKTIADYYLSSF